MKDTATSGSEAATNIREIDGSKYDIVIANSDTVAVNTHVDYSTSQVTSMVVPQGGNITDLNGVIINNITYTYSSHAEKGTGETLADFKAYQKQRNGTVSLLTAGSVEASFSKGDKYSVTVLISNVEHTKKTYTGVVSDGLTNDQIIEKCIYDILGADDPYPSKSADVKAETDKYAYDCEIKFDDSSIGTKKKSGLLDNKSDMTASLLEGVVKDTITESGALGDYYLESAYVKKFTLSDSFTASFSAGANKQDPNDYDNYLVKTFSGSIQVTIREATEADQNPSGDDSGGGSNGGPDGGTPAAPTRIITRHYGVTGIGDDNATIVKESKATLVIGPRDTVDILDSKY
jgi:hypothetical protein